MSKPSSETDPNLSLAVKQPPDSRVGLVPREDEGNPGRGSTILLGTCVHCHLVMVLIRWQVVFQRTGSPLEYLNVKNLILYGIIPHHHGNLIRNLISQNEFSF